MNSQAAPPTGPDGEAGPATTPFPPLSLPLADPPRAVGVPVVGRPRDVGLLGSAGAAEDTGAFDAQAPEAPGALADGPAPGPAAPGAVLADPRVGWWIRRALLAAAAGTVAAIAAGWRLGFVLAAAAAGADALYRARTSSIVPAAARGTSAQRRSRWRLARLSPAGYFALHGRIVPGSGAVIHHLVVGPAGVYALRSERWDRRLPVRATQGGRLYHGPFDQAAQLEEIRDSAARASALISGLLGRQVTVRPAMAIYGPTVPWVVVKIGGVDVFCGRRLRRYLRREAYARRRRRLDDRQVELIHAAAAQVLPPVR